MKKKVDIFDCSATMYRVEVDDWKKRLSRSMDDGGWVTAAVSESWRPSYLIMLVYLSLKL